MWHKYLCFPEVLGNAYEKAIWRGFDPQIENQYLRTYIHLYTYVRGVA